MLRFPLRGKVVLLRVDYNCPLQNGEITDSTKIKTSLPTIQYLLDQNCKLIIATHLGRPEGKVNLSLSTKILIPELRLLLPKVKIHMADNCIGKEVRALVQTAKHGEIIFLENLRFYQEEEDNDPAFAHSLASLGEIYVNDAFGASHRAHASIEAITHFLPSLPGFLIEKEIFELTKALNPKKPSLWILGGAKLDKIDLFHQALRKADIVLVGGALAFSFLKARGISVGLSKVDSKSVNAAKQILQLKESSKIVLPLDFVVTKKIEPRGPCNIVKSNCIGGTQTALDIGPETIELFKIYLRQAQTIVWNGPLGYFEWAQYATGTREIARILAKLTATTICGGGETAEAIAKFHLTHHFTHVSTGGGAALEFLAGKSLPGIVALEQNYKKYKKRFKSLSRFPFPT